MYKKYKTITEAKEHLPEILDRIDLVRKLAEMELGFYQCSIAFCLLETTLEICPNFGSLTDKKEMLKTYENYNKYTEEIEYLYKVLDLIKYDIGT